MSPHTGSIRAEVNYAVAKGIRRRGPDAVGLVLMGMARLVLAASALAIFLAAGALSGDDVTAPHVAGATAVVAVANWLVGRQAGR